MKKHFLILVLFGYVKLFSQSATEKTTCPLEFATVFTVNSETDDDWQFASKCKIAKFHLQIYSRWGNEVFKTDSLPLSGAVKWDWKKLSAGTYFYVLEYTTEQNGVPATQNLKGSVTLMTDPDKKGNREE